MASYAHNRGHRCCLSPGLQRLRELCMDRCANIPKVYHHFRIAHIFSPIRLRSISWESCFWWIDAVELLASCFAQLRGHRLTFSILCILLMRTPKYREGPLNITTQRYTRGPSDYCDHRRALFSNSSLLFLSRSILLRFACQLLPRGSLVPKLANKLPNMAPFIYRKIKIQSVFRYILVVLCFIFL